MVTRRRLVQLATGAAAAWVGSAVPGWVARAQQPLMFAGFGGAYQEGQRLALFAPFEQETGIKILDVSANVDLGVLREQVQQRLVRWDILTLPDRLLLAAIREGLLDRIDYNIVDASDIQFNTVHEYYVGAVVLAMMLTYRVSAFTATPPPKDWVDFWTLAKFPGRRALFDGPAYVLEFALLADGVQRERLYPLDIDRAFRSLDRLRPAVRVWWKNFSDPAWLFESQRIEISPWTRTPSAIRRGQPLGYSYDGAAFTFEGWCVPRFARNRDWAMRFINFALQPRQQAALTEQIMFGPTNKNALALIDPALQPLLPSNPVNVAQGFFLSGEYWGAYLGEVTERWNRWRFA